MNTSIRYTWKRIEPGYYKLMNPTTERFTVDFTSSSPAG